MKNRSATAQTLQTMGHKYSKQIQKAVLVCLTLLLSLSFALCNVSNSTVEEMAACENALRGYIENPEQGIDTALYNLSIEGATIELSVRNSFATTKAVRAADGTYHFTTNRNTFSFCAAFVVLWIVVAIVLYYSFYGILYLLITGIKYIFERIKDLRHEYTTTKNMATFNISKEDAEEYPEAARLKEAYEAGFKKGYDEGFIEGRTAGFEQGLDDAYDYGFDEGHGNGYVEGVNYAMQSFKQIEEVVENPDSATEIEE